MVKLTITFTGAPRISMEKPHISADKTEVRVGEQVNINCTVRLDSPATQDLLLDTLLYANNNVISEKTILVKKGEKTGECTFNVSFKKPGRYVIQADVGDKISKLPAKFIAPFKKDVEIPTTIDVQPGIVGFMVPRVVSDHKLINVENAIITDVGSEWATIKTLIEKDTEIKLIYRKTASMYYWFGGKNGSIKVYDIWYSEESGKINIDIEVDCGEGGDPSDVVGAIITVDGTIIGSVGCGRTTFSKKWRPPNTNVCIHAKLRYGGVIQVITIPARNVRVIEWRPIPRKKPIATFDWGVYGVLYVYDARIDDGETILEFELFPGRTGTDDDIVCTDICDDYVVAEKLSGYHKLEFKPAFNEITFITYYRNGCNGPQPTVHCR